MSRSRTLAFLLLGSLLLLAPVAARAGERTQRDDITITRDADFDRAHGVRSGRGTVRDPYVISGWEVSSITLADTNKAVVIEDNSIDWLTLNWNGPNVTVRRNDIFDLRVNENVERTGAPTSGVFERNRINQVGQLRHFDGMFMHNEVGDPEGAFTLWSSRAVNFDGFNGAHFAYNTIYGYVDARLHGHHHSTGFGRSSHMHTAKPAGEHDGHGHGEEGEGHADHAMVDHTKRWHEVKIHDNTIISRNWYALSYTDTAHQVNDRTATSETDPALEEPHRHFTRVSIARNRLQGGGILVDVFNAEDDLHEKIGPGSMRIVGNTIDLSHGPYYPFEARNGIEVRQARQMTLRIVNNTVTAPDARYQDTLLAREWDNMGAGVLLSDIHGARVRIHRLRVSNRAYGVQATVMSERVRWSVSKLLTENVGQDVWYDGSVANEPQRS